MPFSYSRILLRSRKSGIVVDAYWNWRLMMQAPLLITRATVRRRQAVDQLLPVSSSSHTSVSSTSTFATASYMRHFSTGGHSNGNDNDDEDQDDDSDNLLVDGNDSDSDSDSDSDVPSTLQTGQELPPFNTKNNNALLEYIRSGLGSLNQSALEIQSSASSKKSLFAQVQDMRKVIFKQTRQTLLFQTAQRALNSLVHDRNKGQLFFLEESGGDPIELLECVVKGHKQAIIYWSLPTSILISQRWTKLDKQYLEYKMHQQLTTQGGQSLLQKTMVHMLRNALGYPPSIKLEPATDAQLKVLAGNLYDTFHGDDNIKKEEDIHKGVNE